MRYFEGVFNALRIVEDEYATLKAECIKYHFFEEAKFMLDMDFIVDGKEISVEYVWNNDDWYFREEYRWDE